MKDPAINWPISPASVLRHPPRFREPALRDHREPVADLEELVQLLGDHQHGHARLAQVDQRLADLRRRAHVHAPRRLRGDHHARRLADLAPDDVLLQVAARQAAGRGPRPAGLHAEGPDRVLGEGAHRIAAHEAVGDHVLPVRGEQRVVGERHLRHGAAAEALLGHEGEASLAPLRGVEPAHRLAVEADRVGFRQRALAREGGHQLLLPVARHARDADDLPGVHGERDRVQRGPERVVGGQREVVDHQALDAGFRFRVARVRKVAADHHPGERGRALLARVAGAGDAPAAQHGRLLAERADLVELVADVEDAAALVGELAQRLEELLHGLRREHRGGLVHDEEPRALQQAAHDLHALALAHAHRVHVAVRVERQAVVRRDLADALRQVVARVVGLQRQRDVLGDGERLEQREVLEHHADAQPPRARGIRDDHGRAFPRDRAGVGLHHAVDDLHQRRLAGAVLAEHGVDLAGQHVERDAVVGDDGRVDLGDAAQRKAGGGDAHRRGRARGRPGVRGAAFSGGRGRSRDADATRAFSHRFAAVAAIAPRSCGCTAAARSRTCSSSAATPTAMTPGSLLASAAPIGQVTRAMSSRGRPRRSRRCSNWVRFATRADQSDVAPVLARERGLDDGEVEGVAVGHHHEVRAAREVRHLGGRDRRSRGSRRCPAPPRGSRARACRST